MSDQMQDELDRRRAEEDDDRRREPVGGLGPTAPRDGELDDPEHEYRWTAPSQRAEHDRLAATERAAAGAKPWKGTLRSSVLFMLLAGALVGAALYLFKGKPAAERLPGMGAEVIDGAAKLARDPSSVLGKVLGEGKQGSGDSLPPPTSLGTSSKESGAVASAADAPQAPLALPREAGALDGAAVPAGDSMGQTAASPAAPAPSPALPATVDVQRLDERLQRIETLLEELQRSQATASPRPAGSAAPVAAKADGPDRPAAVHAPRATPTSRHTRVTPPPAAQAPALGGQLLAVDMWNGAPSVVVTSGVPGDGRTRVLRPGDTLNGVSLLSADPASGTATFGVQGGRSFNLSTRQGG